MRLKPARKLSIFIIPPAGGEAVPRTLTISPWALPALLLTLVAGFGALGLYAFQAHRALNSQVDRSAEVESLTFTKASLEAQLNVFAGRVEALDRRLDELKQNDLEVAALKEDVSRQLGLAPEAPLDEVLPYLRSTISWVDQAGGAGGSEYLGGSLSGVVAGSARDLIRGMHRDLDRLQMETDDLGRYLATVKGGLSGSGSILSASPLFLPVSGTITDRFGQRVSPFGSSELALHRGLDITAPPGTLVRVPADGTVLSVGQTGGYGLLVTIDHGFGLVTRYGHLSETLVEAGATVSRGQSIARSGNSGRSTGPHLHYETILGGVAVDPLKLLPPGHSQANYHEPLWRPKVAARAGELKIDSGGP